MTFIIRTDSLFSIFQNDFIIMKIVFIVLRELTDGRRELTDQLSDHEHKVQQYQKDVDMKSTGLAKALIEVQAQRTARKSAQQLCEYGEDVLNQQSL